MKIFERFFIAASLLMFPLFNQAQSPNLGTAADFVLFTTVGAVGNTGTSFLTGNVGTNSGSITGFGNVNGVMHANDGASAQCAADLLILYNQLNSAIPTFFPAPLLGNGQILVPGVYHISSPASLNNVLTLNAQNNPDALFIIRIQGAFSTGANAKVKLINGAKACNVFWKVEGLVSMAAGTFMRGNIVANNAAITMNTGDTLEGRALSTSGAVNVSGVLAYTPVGCGSPVHMGPAAPALLSTACFGIFSANGPVYNAGITHVQGDVGTNVGLTTGFNPLFVDGFIHPIPDVVTAQAAADLGIVYTYLNTLPVDIELLYPAQFGNNLVLTPHTYLLNAATSFNGNLYLNAEGQADAVFVFKIFGALSTSTYAKVILINGAQAKNIFWEVNGAVSINDYSEFKGTIVANNGAVELATGVNLNGRAMTTTGALSTAAIVTTLPPGCVSGTGNTIHGIVHYDNTVSTPMSNTTLTLKNGNQVVATTITNSVGYYSFSGLNDGTYTIEATTTKAWGGVNATDALIILKQFVGFVSLTGLPLIAADVDASGSINSVDALLASRRFVGAVSSFPAGNWVFDSVEITLSGNSIYTQNIAALCVGDVNRSHVPAVKSQPSVFLGQSGNQVVSPNSVFDYPLYSSSDMTLTALSMVLQYPVDAFEISAVLGPEYQADKPDSETQTILWTANQGELRISWYSLTPVTLSANQAMITLKMKVKGSPSFVSANTEESMFRFSMDAGSEVADQNAIPLSYVSLTAPKLSALNTNTAGIANQPNPFTANTQFNYFIPADSKVKLSVFTILGESIATLVNEQQSAGSHSLNYNTEALHSGIYFYKLEVNSRGSESVQTAIMIKNR